MYDIIGDIHGQAERLINLLIKLGYNFTEQGWQHSQYKAIFVGDLIDRGPDQLKTLSIVKQMVDNNNAMVVMGNHEFNAIGWATPHSIKTDNFLRPHTERNFKQHKIFLDAFEQNADLYQFWINWFKQLPIFIEIEGIRIIHACWDNTLIQQLHPYIDNKHRLLSCAWEYAFNNTHILYSIIETLLKGKEIELPPGVSYQDKDGITRNSTRIKWWLKEATSLNQLYMMTQEQLSKIPKQQIPEFYQGYNDPQPLFIGHYWLTGQPARLTQIIACVDYSAAVENGKLVAYRWSGESILSDRNFIY